jgi:hypothetical protein
MFAMPCRRALSTVPTTTVPHHVPSLAASPRRPRFHGRHRCRLRALARLVRPRSVGRLDILTPEAEDVLVYRRVTEDREMIVAVNVRDEAQAVPVPPDVADASLTDALSGEAVEADSLDLGAYGYRLLRVE